MPVAVCHLRQGAGGLDPDAMVQDWARRAECDAGVMTVLLSETRSGGDTYAALADLALPTIWSRERAQDIAKALSEVLCAALAVEAAEIEVHTRWVQSGDVVSGGAVLDW